MSSASQKMIVLESSDGVLFEVEEAVALKSQYIKDIIDACADTSIPLPNVNSKTLAKVFEYCKRHVEANDATAKEDGLKAFHAEFVKVDHSTLYDLMLAAHYLNIESLLDETCQTVADMLEHKRPEEIREILNIKNDCTPEEEAKEIHRKNQWAFE